MVVVAVVVVVEVVDVEVEVAEVDSCRSSCSFSAWDSSSIGGSSCKIIKVEMIAESVLLQ